jgi:hypothetical protein
VAKIAETPQARWLGVKRRARGCDEALREGCQDEVSGARAGRVQTFRIATVGSTRADPAQRLKAAGVDSARVHPEYVEPSVPMPNSSPTATRSPPSWGGKTHYVLATSRKAMGLPRTTTGVIRRAERWRGARER